MTLSDWFIDKRTLTGRGELQQGNRSTTLRLQVLARSLNRQVEPGVNAECIPRKICSPCLLQMSPVATNTCSLVISPLPSLFWKGKSHYFIAHPCLKCLSSARCNYDELTTTLWADVRHGTRVASAGQSSRP